MWRRQLPAWSPVTARALAAGVTAWGHGGRHVAALETRLRSEYGAGGVRLADSGTGALALAMLAAAAEGARPSVAMPAWACYDLMTAADIADAEVILYDLDPATLGPSPASFTAALERRPSAVVVAHWFGLPVPLTPLLAEARDAGAMVIEDAAQGVGGAIGERPLGSLGDYGILSFGRGKGRTGGCGGAVLANNSIAVTQLQRIAQLVNGAPPGKRGLLALAAQWGFGRPWLYGIPSSIPSLRLGETVYHPARPVCAMPEWAAAVVGALWQRSALESATRREVAARWAEVVARCSSASAFAVSGGTTGGWLRFPVLAHNPATLRNHSARCLGVMPGYEGTLAGLPRSPGRLVNPGAFPGATELAARLCTLPTHSLVRAGDIAAIAGLLAREERRRP